jgi:hypothetical protein
VQLITEENKRILKDRAMLNKIALHKMNEKKEVAEYIISIINQYEGKLDTDLAAFEQELQLSGDYEVPQGLQPHTEVLHFPPNLFLIIAVFIIFNCYYRWHVN